MCRVPRWDISGKENGLFPIYIEKGGNLYDFCPGKSTWDVEAVSLYKLLVISADTGIMPENGSLLEQADWWVDLLSWFLPIYSDTRFYSRARAILGDGKAATNGNNNRRSIDKNRSRSK